MLQVGSLRRLRYEMMGRQAVLSAIPVRKHLRLIGIKSIDKYMTAVRRFFSFLNLTEYPWPVTDPDMCEALAEFVNYLWQDERPFDWASTFCSGFARLCPMYKHNLAQARIYVKNWNSVLDRTRAFPYTVEMVQAMASFLHLQAKPHMAVLVLVAFAGLFRIGELLHLRIRQVEFVSPEFCIVSLRNTKSKRGAVSVVLTDRTVIKALKALVVKRPKAELVFQVSYKALSIFLRDFAGMLRIPGDRFTGHGFRRGGATHYFKVWGAYDRVQALGRWAEAKTCMSYIDEAVADKVMLTLGPAGRRVLRDGVEAFPDALTRLCSQLTPRASKDLIIID